MRKDKEKAVLLRKEGKSYREIGGELHIPRSTLSDWFADEKWSAAIREHLAASAQETSTVRMVALNKLRGERLEKAYEAAVEEAKKELETLKYDPLFLSGVMLYWGEGSKDPRQGVKFADSDPAMIKLYVAFLKKSCRIPIEMIKAYVLIYPEIEEKTARAYWSKVSGLPWGQFTKSVVITGRHATRRLSWGVCTVSVSSTYFKRKMLEWIKLLPEELLRKEYYENITR
ncbi:MAG: helix-turn-helix domain containing protein [Candidatus Pacebacteria bacterium]|nr:helix-turn-helix domain containing protein [Candidatus Paceibacterota bacterium]